MTVTASVRKAGPFLGNGVTTTFPFAFKVFSKTDIAITKVSAIGVESTLVLDSAYSVALNADQDNTPGGTITYPLSGAPLATGEQLLVLGSIQSSQALDITDMGRFLPSAIESALDRETILLQQLEEKVGRALLVSPLEAGFTKYIPAARGNRALYFDASGQPSVSTFTMEQVANAVAAAYTPSAGTLDALTFLQAGAGAYPRTAQNKSRDIYSVRDFGAIGDSGGHTLSERFATLAAAQAFYPHATALTDIIDWCAVQAAVNAIPAGSSYTKTIYFPSGQYVINKPIDMTGRNIALQGDGPRSSVLLVNADITVLKFDATGCPGACIGMMDMGIAESGSRTAMIGMTVRNTGDFFLQNVYITTSGKAIDIGSSGVDVTFSMLSQVRVETYGAQEAIRLRCGGGNWSNVYARKQRLVGVTGPCLWISGQSTSLEVSNSTFGGKGTPKATKITAIAGFPTFFDVAIPGNAALVGEQILIRGTGTAYDGVWKIAIKNDADTIRINSTINIGNLTPANAFVDKMHAIVYMENSVGPVNESTWSSVLFEGIDDGGSAGGAGSVSLYLDASPGVNSIAGHQFNACTFDGGQIGVAMLGKNIGGGDYCISDIRFSGMIVRYARYGIYLREVRGVRITDFGGDCLRFRASAGEQADSTAIYLDGNGTQPIIGITINNSVAGRQTSYHLGSINSFSASYGLRFAGPVQDIKLVASHFFGLTQAVLIDTGTSPDPTSRIVDTDCTYAAGAGGESGATAIPGVTAAATITMPFGLVIGISGASTTISTINGGWVGRTVLVYTGLSQTFSTAGNIANAKTTVAGEAFSALYDGLKWHLG